MHPGDLEDFSDLEMTWLLATDLVSKAKANANDYLEMASSCMRKISN